MNNMVEQLAVLLPIWEVCLSSFETQFGNQLFRIRFLTVFLNHSMQMLGQYYNTAHNHFLPQSSQFIVHKSPYHIMPQNQYSSKSIINKWRISHTKGTKNCMKISEFWIKFWQNRFKHEVKHYGLRSINSLILFGIRKNCLISGWSLVLYHFTRAIKLTVVIIMGYHCYQLNTKFYPISFLQIEVHM
jgi:hypothetical protein